MSYITIPSHDGQEFNAYIAKPDTPNGSVVIMIQEIFGINQEMREKCDLMAEKGYIAVAPDLFWRIEPGIDLMDDKPEQLERAFELFGLFDAEQGMKDLASTVSHVRGLEGVNGKVGAVGYCLGGMLSYRLGCESDIDAAVSYYGVSLDSMTDKAAALSGQMLMHIAANDEYVPPEAQAKITADLETNNAVEIHVYDGQDHAFARTGGMHYDAQAADLANGRTDAFLKKHLG